MSEISHHPGMDIESTFECPHCHKDLPIANQLTHEVACARMSRDNQRAPVAQPIVRQSSSSALPDAQPRSQPMPRREDRRVAELAENKLVNCPNCEKSVREQDINSHMDNECLKNEMIPCEFCDEAVPMSDYNQHVEGCPRRSQNRRDQSPLRERMESESSQEQHEEHEEEEEEEQPQGPSDRERAPGRGSSQGGVRGFLRTLGNVAGTAATHLLGLDPESQQQREQQRQQALERRRREEERQREFLEHMFGQPQVPRNLAPSNQNALIPYNGPSGGQRVVRTIERGPGGVVIVRSRVVPANNQFQMLPQQQPMNRPMEVNPLEMLLGMMGGNFGGMMPIGNGEFEGGAPEQSGLNKETIDSLALIKYSKEANKNVSEDLKKCPICLDDFDEGQEVRFLWCTHRFHRGCVDKWLESHTNCPICKKDFSEAEQGFSP